MRQRRKFAPEVKERVVRLVRDHRGEYPTKWAAICSVAEKFGCAAETLRLWMRQAQVDDGERGGVPSAEQDRIKALERENRELRRANEILRKASAFFAQAEFDRLPR
jgi:transposase